MDFELDHLFVCTDLGAPEANRLVELGFSEGPPNQHLGQGTANRRFPFANAMIEFLWVSDPGEAQSQRTRRTLLWERWSGRKSNASPFGICLRPTHPQAAEPPFPGWRYEPDYLPMPLFMHMAESGIDEPMWVYLNFMKKTHREHQFIQHANGAREITGLTLTTPTPLRSPASQTIVDAGVLQTKTGTHSHLEIEFDGGQRKERFDLRPHLPVILIQ